MSDRLDEVISASSRWSRFFPREIAEPQVKSVAPLRTRPLLHPSRHVQAQLPTSPDTQWSGTS
jgi:hypothetical protein